MERRDPPRSIRALIALFPAHVRETDRRELETLTRDLWRASASRSAWSRTLFRCRIAIDLIVGAAIAWVEKLLPAEPAPPIGRHQSRDGIRELSLGGDMLTELRIALRRLVMSPSFTLPAIATLSVGIAGTVGIFGTMNATVLRPLPYPDSEDLFTLNTTRVDGRWSDGRLTSAEITALVSRAPSITHVVGTFSAQRVVLRDDGQGREVTTQMVTDGFFDLVGLPMAVGRPFRADAPVDGTFGPAVLSHSLWSELYAADSAVIGSTLRFADGPATIVQANSTMQERSSIHCQARCGACGERQPPPGARR